MKINTITHILIDKPKHQSECLRTYLDTLNKLLDKNEADKKRVRVVDIDWLFQCFFCLEQLSSAKFLYKL